MVALIDQRIAADALSLAVTDFWPNVKVLLYPMFDASFRRFWYVDSTLAMFMQGLDLKERNRQRRDYALRAQWMPTFRCIAKSLGMPYEDVPEREPLTLLPPGAQRRFDELGIAFDLCHATKRMIEDHPRHFESAWENWRLGLGEWSVD